MGNKKIVIKGKTDEESDEMDLYEEPEEERADGSKEEKKYLNKTMLNWEGFLIDPRGISTIETSTSYATRASSGMVFLLDIGIFIPPYHKIFEYATEELCELKRDQLLEKLKKLGLKIV